MRLPRRSRVRRILKWGGLVPCVLIFLMWALTTTVVRNTRLNVEYVGDDTHLRFLVGAIYCSSPVHWTVRRADLSGWRIYKVHPRKQDAFFRFWRRDHGFLLPAVRPYWNRTAYIPLWLPFATLAIPTAYLFWPDSRCPPEGHCQSCGYNLTGNVSGVCPECGTGVGLHPPAKG